MFSEWISPDGFIVFPGIGLNLTCYRFIHHCPGSNYPFFFEDFYLTSRYSNLRSLILDISSREVKFGIGGTKFLLIEAIIINLNFIVVGFTKFQMASFLWIEHGPCCMDHTSGPDLEGFFVSVMVLLNSIHHEKYFQELYQGIIVDKHISRYDIHLCRG